MLNKPDQGNEGLPSLNQTRELRRIAETLEELHQRGRQDEIQKPLEDLQAAAEEMSKSSSGSWIGYHANVYYENFLPPPPGAHFSKEWGIQPRAFIQQGTTGNWVEYDPEDVKAEIYRRAGNPTLEPARTFHRDAIAALHTSQREIDSILEILMDRSNSTFLSNLQGEAKGLSGGRDDHFIQTLAPRSKSFTRDSLAVSQGYWTPPHMALLSQVFAIGLTKDNIIRLAEIARQAETHMTRQRRQEQPESTTGTTVFLGHGHSQIWRELKEFLTERLSLEVDEFNRVSPAGIPTTERLETMLDTAGFALLIMTGEDEQNDGKLRARENVVHEAGLFQGRLGFKRAIILLEEGCQEFNNIIGLGQIRFPKGNIKATFEEIREVLEREEILSG